MARCAVAGRTDAVPTSLKGPSLYATAAVRPQIRKIEVYNTTVTACAVAVVRATATGTQGTALTEVCMSDDSRTVIATGFNTHSVNATVGSPVAQASLGAAVGSGVIWSWEEGAFIIDNATTAGVVIICPTGTGQHLDFCIEWEE
jgi:hypothetical protein